MTDLKNRLIDILKKSVSDTEQIEAYKRIFSFIDLTTLEGTDTNKTVKELCQKARMFNDQSPQIPNVAAICVYPNFIKLVKRELTGRNIKTASVAGAFPSGQTSLQIKLEEIKYAIDQGADEIDMVISRGKFLEGDVQYVEDEIASIKELCIDVHLKVILECGELGSVENIRKASELAIKSGADFIKTSTGKIQPAATEEAVLVMADAIKEFYNSSGKKIGIKPAGGISTAEQALKYYLIIRETLGIDWLNNRLFRIGASRLADDVYKKIVG
ncbi:deoxyribose-phosphate aldolase, partial [candidate division KSB1 bacterium]